MNLDYKKLIKGEEVKCIVRIKPPINFQREDVRYNNPNIIFTDQNNRILQEFEVPDVYGPTSNVLNIFEQSMSPYINALIKGLNISCFALGSTGSGKTLSMEGNMKEPGMMILFVASILELLNNKRVHANSDGNQVLSNFEYDLLMQYVEIIDERIIDLLENNKHTAQPLSIEDDTWEGPSIKNGKWVSVGSEEEFSGYLHRGISNRHNTTNEFGKISSKATAIMVIKLTQTCVVKQSNEPIIMQSRISFFDMPGTEALIDDPETMRIKQGATINKSITCFAQLLKDLTTTNQDYVIYNTSTLTRFLKETLGSNALSIALFCIQQGDQKGSIVTLNMLNTCRELQSYPIVNDGKSLAIMHRFRQDLISNGIGNVSNQVELASKSIEDGTTQQKQLQQEKDENTKKQNIISIADERVKMGIKITELRQKYSDLVRQKAELQQDLIKSEEEKLEIARSLVEMEMENTRLLDIISNEKFNSQSKLLNGINPINPNDDMAASIREEKALQTISELQDRMKEILEDKRELELEFMALKKNYIFNLQELESERMKQETFGIQIINIQNENRVLQDDLRESYKITGTQGDSGKKLIERIESLERENREKSEQAIFMRAEIERLKTQMLKNYVDEKHGEVKNALHELEVDKSLVFNNRKLQTPDVAVQRQKDEKMLWESQKMELTHKVRTLQRRVTEDNDRIKDLERQVQDLLGDTARGQIQVDEMRSVYRSKLIQVANKDPQQIREELQKELQINEQQLRMDMERMRKQVTQQNADIKALRSYSRNLRYIAEDWAPLGQPMPDILTREPPFLIDLTEPVSSISQDQKNEIERLKSRNKRQEDQIKVLQDESIKIYHEKATMKNDIEIKNRIQDEIGMLRDSKRPQSSSSVNVEELKKERNEMQEENRNLVKFMKENKKWDVFMHQKENERLMGIIKENEGKNFAPSSDQNQSNKKFAFYEQAIKQCERDKTDLLVRATIAEEQLMALQQGLTRITQSYQKKINDLKKQISNK